MAGSEKLLGSPIGIVLATLLTVGAIWFVYSVVTADDDLDCARERANASARGEPAPDCD